MIWCELALHRYCTSSFYLFYLLLSVDINIPYFLGYKTDFFPSKNDPKDLDPSYKMDLDLSDCLGRVKLVL